VNREVTAADFQTRRPYTEDQRALLIRMVDEGIQRPKIATALGRHIGSVSGMIFLFRKKGLIRRPARPYCRG
jgi:transposase